MSRLTQQVFELKGGGLASENSTGFGIPLPGTHLHIAREFLDCAVSIVQKLIKLRNSVLNLANTTSKSLIPLMKLTVTKARNLVLSCHLLIGIRIKPNVECIV